MRSNLFRQAAVAISLIATIAINILANRLPLNDLTTGQISDRFDIFFVPAGYVFSIWGIIYLGLIAYGVFQALPAQRENPRLAATGWLFVLNCVANIAWLFFWHYEQFYLTLPTMLLILSSLIAIYLRLETGKTAVRPAETWSVRVPFSIYLGWITVATIANTTQLLYFLNWSGWGVSASVWAVIMLAAAVLIGGLMSYTRRDAAYSLVLAWAFAGIAVKHADTALVTGAAWAAAAMVLALVLLFAVLKIPRPRTTSTA